MAIFSLECKIELTSSIKQKGESIIRFRKKFPQINSERHSELIANNWIQLREPKDLASSILAAIPLTILSALPSLIILNILSPFSLADFGITPSQEIEITIYLQDLVYFIGLSIAITFIHELIHLVFVPHFLTSDKAFLGIAYFGGFIYSEEVLSKSRFTLMLLTPFVCNFNNTAWNSGGCESIKSAGKVCDFIKCDGFRHGYVGLDPYTDPGACGCVFYLQRNKNLLEKNR